LQNKHDADFDAEVTTHLLLTYCKQAPTENKHLLKTSTYWKTSTMLTLMQQ
jgi:hypothetical protein